MTDRLAATALRLLAPRANALGFDDHDSLQNVITDELPNGALCWVNKNETLYVLKKTSTAAPIGDAIIAPLAGPGRWFALVGALLEQFSFYAAMTSLTTEVIISDVLKWTPLNFINPPPSWTTQDVIKGAGIVEPTEFWTIGSPGPGILTYSGPSGLFLGEADVTIFTAPTAPPQIVDIYLSKNGAFIGSTDELVREQRVHLVAGTSSRELHMHVATRVRMEDGDTLQLLTRNFTDTSSIFFSFIQLYVSPLF